jgi:hypothetical protein
MDHVPLIVPRLVIGLVTLVPLIYSSHFLEAKEHVSSSDSRLFAFACRVVIQLLCSYSTLPLYAIVTQVIFFTATMSVDQLF